MEVVKSGTTRRRLLALATIAAGSRFYPTVAESKREKAATGATTFFYRPANPGNFWDTWIYYHNGLFHLYHLWGPQGDPVFNFDCIAMATSRDGVHWEERGR